MNYRKGAATRQNIVSNARIVLNKKGTNLTLVELAEFMGVVLGTITNHFRTKDHLFVAISQEYQEQYLHLKTNIDWDKEISLWQVTKYFSSIMDLQYEYRCAIFSAASTSSSQKELYGQIRETYKLNRANSKKMVALFVKGGIFNYSILYKKRYEIFSFLTINTYGYSDKTFLKNWSCAIMHEYPKLSLMGEEWSYNPLITSYWQTGKKNRDGYTSCLNTIMDFPLQDALVKSLNGKEDASYNEPFTKIYEMMANVFVYANPNQMLVMGDNHDMDRLYTKLNQDVELTQMALTFLLTIRGIPQLFYGTEILMDNTGHHKVDGLIRADFPGGWKEDTVNAFTGSGLNNNQSGIQSYVKKLLGWRKDNPVIASGKTLHFAPFNGIYTYFRYNKEKTVMVVMNINDVVTSIDTDRFAEILKGKTSAVNVVSEETIDIKRNISIGPKSAIVLEIK